MANVPNMPFRKAKRYVWSLIIAETEKLHRIELELVPGIKYQAAECMNIFIGPKNRHWRHVHAVVGFEHVTNCRRVPP